MKLKSLTFVVGTAFFGHYANASESVVLDELKVLGEIEEQKGYANQFKQTTTTGSKLGLTIKETPVSIEIIDAQTLKQRSDDTVIRAVTKAVGINGGSSGHGTIGNYSVRGFTGYPGIDFLHDGIKLNGTIFSKRVLDISNLDRIEIIRGASSVLNGEGSIGATINLIPKKPSFNKKGTELGIKTASHDSYSFNFGHAGVAVEDKLAYRIDATTRQLGSDFHGEKREVDTISASVLYKIDESLLTSLFLETTKDNGTQDYQGTPLVNGRLDKRVRRINYNNLNDGFDKGDNIWLKHVVEWFPTDNIEIKNQLYYQNTSSDIRRLYLAVQDTSNPNLVNRRGYDSSQKQRLIGNRLDFSKRGELLGLKNRFHLGLDVSRLELDREQSTYAGRIVSTSMFNPEKLNYRDFFNTTGDDYKKPDVNIKMNQIAIYVEDQLTVTDRLKLVGSLRHDSYNIDYDFKQGLSSPTNQNIDRKHNKLSYRGGLVFDATDTITVYASYASSFEPGDASASLLTVNAAQTQLDLTKARQYEIGLRQSFFDNKAEFTASTYYITKENMFVNNPTPGTGLLNVGKQTAKGIEMALGIRPTGQWEFDGNLSYVDSKYDEFVHNGIDYSGRRPSSIPNFMANIGLRYSPIPNLGFGTWVRHVGSMYTDNIGFANSVKLPSYSTVDLTLDYRYDKNTYFNLAIKNLTDEIYATTARRDSQVFLGEARRLEFSVNYKF